MPQEIQRVQPGDLITSAFMNRFVDKIQLLESRIAALEALGPGGASVIVTSLFPPGPIRIRQELQVRGKNFGLSSGTNIVYVDDVLVTAYKSGSDDTLLIFDIPDIPNVPLVGRPGNLTVGNQSSSVQQTIFLLPAQPLQGLIEVTWLGVTPVTLIPNNPATFEFRLRSRTNLDATFSITPAIDISIAGDQEWLNNMEVLDNFQQLNPSRTVFLPTNSDTVFFIRINPVPNVPNNTPFTLSVNASADNVRGGSGPINITLNEAVGQPDQSVSMTLQSAVFSPQNSGSIELGAIEDTIRLQNGGTAQISFQAEFREIGTYDVLISPIGSTNNWNLRRHPQSATSYTITLEMFNNEQQKHDELPRYLITPEVNASETGEVEFIMRRQGDNESRSIRMNLVLDP